LNRHYTQRIAAIRNRYEAERLRYRLWCSEMRDKYERFEADAPALVAYPDQLLINIYGKAVRKLRKL